MTDDRRFHVIGKGRLLFDSFDPPSLMRPRERSTWTGKLEMSPMGAAQLALLLGRDPIPHIVEHDPQKLLPSPERVWKDAIARYFRDITLDGEHVFTPVMQTPPIDEPATQWKKAVIVIDDFSTSIAEAVKAVSAMSNVLAIDIDIHPSIGYLPPGLFLPRWNDSGADPLGDLSRWREEVFRQTSRTHREEFYLKMPRYEEPVGEPLAKQSHKPYLKHDPTKQHNRRRRRK